MASWRSGGGQARRVGALLFLDRTRLWGEEVGRKQKIKRIGE